MSLSRREFLQTSVAATSLATLSSLAVSRAADSPNEKIVVGVMGTNGRGTSLAERFAGMPNTTVAVVCDVDERNAGKAATAVEKIAGKRPTAVGDFRKILDDKSIDALVIAAPDHWHAPGTILGCTAGKHVYVEKPASHNPREGELMVAAARKHKRVVQLGTQRRSMPGIREAIDKLHAGVIGPVLMAKCAYYNPRPSIGHGKPAPIPAWLDYALWQGPAPDREYRDNLVHYNWHWFWHWGTGELGNNGVHTVDVCRWGLGVDYPTRVTSAGGRYRYDDDQQTPDTNIATFEFGNKAICWEGRSWAGKGPDSGQTEIVFIGEQGSLAIGGGGYKIYDEKGKEVAKTPGDGAKTSTSDAPHVQNFLEGIRSGAQLNAEIEEGFKSTLLCLLGNISYRTGHALTLDPQTHQPVGDPQATELWSREYRPGWEPKV
jgi:predicted dehydrogenase